MGTIVQANTSKIYAKKETTWGTAATGNYGTIRITGADFRLGTETAVSGILSTSREPGDVIRTNIGAEGTLNFETDLTFGVLGTAAAGPISFFNSVFGNELTADLGIDHAIDVTTVVAGDTCKWIGTSSVFANIKAGDWVRANGFVNGANNGTYFVSAKTSDTDITIKNPNAIAETTATNVFISGKRLVFGPTLTSLSIEQEIGTVEKLYHLYTGMVGRSISLNMAPGSIMTGSVSFLGKNVTQSISSGAGGTPVAAATSTILNSIDHIYAIYEGRQGVAETWKVANMTLNIENDLGPMPALQTLGNVSVRMGRASVRGSMSIYAEHGVSETNGIKQIYDSYIAGTARSEGASIPGGISVILNDGSTHVALSINKWFITNASIPIRGTNDGIFLDLDFAAQVHANATNGPTSNNPTAFSMHVMVAV